MKERHHRYPSAVQLKLFVVLESKALRQLYHGSWFWDVLGIPSRELTYPLLKALLKMIFLFPRWDMLVPRRVFSSIAPIKKS